MLLDIEKKIRSWVDEKMEEEDWKGCFFIEAKANGRKLAVYLDCDSGISFGRCRKMSRHLEAYLDEMEYHDGRYLLEVSSPGIERPIFLKRQFEKNVGRSIRFLLKDESDIIGELLQLKGDKLKIERPHPEKKKTMMIEEFDINDVEKATVQISFKKRKK